MTLFCPPREAEIVHVRGMWFSDSWPIYFTSGPGSRVACIVFKMCWLQPILGWKLHVLCPGRQNILSEGLCQVRVKDWPPSFYSWPSSFFSILVLLVIEENWWDRYEILKSPRDLISTIAKLWNLSGVSATVCYFNDTFKYSCFKKYVTIICTSPPPKLIHKNRLV